MVIILKLFFGCSVADRLTTCLTNQNTVLKLRKWTPKNLGKIELRMIIEFKISVVTGPWGSIATFVYCGIWNFAHKTAAYGRQLTFCLGDPKLKQFYMHLSCMVNNEWDSDFSGRRMCMGEQMTRVEMFLVVSHLLHMYSPSHLHHHLGSHQHNSA